MEEYTTHATILRTNDYALCKQVNTRNRNYGKYVVLKCTLKRLDYWEPISQYYNDRHTAESIYRRLIDGSKNL